MNEFVCECCDLPLDLCKQKKNCFCDYCDNLVDEIHSTCSECLCDSCDDCYPELNYILTVGEPSEWICGECVIDYYIRLENKQMKHKTKDKIVCIEFENSLE